MKRWRTRVFGVLLTLLLLSLAPSAAIAEPVVAAQGTWSDGNGHTYVVVLDRVSTDWNDAATDVTTRFPGFHLATLTSPEELAFVVGLMSDVDSAGFWLGALQDPISEPDAASGWTWVTGEPWDFANWEGAEPNDACGPASEQHLMTSKFGQWNDLSTGCGHTDGYIAESLGAAAVCLDGQVGLSGTVTRDSDGGPLTEVTSVSIVAVDGSYADGEATTLPASTYSTCVPANTTYTVAFQADSYLIEWYDNVFDPALATPVVVTDSDVTGIDASLGQATITGRVTDQRTGDPLFTSVSVVNADTGAGYDNEGTDPTTGIYTMAVPPGRWVIGFAADYHWAEWSGNKKKFSKARVIEVTQLTPSFTGIDARLRLCSRTVPDFCFPKHFND